MGITMKAEDVYDGMRVRMIVPNGESTYYGRDGVPCGEIGIAEYLDDLDEGDLGVSYPRLTKEVVAELGGEYAWDDEIWYGKLDEFEPVGPEDWWEIWASV